MRLIRIFFIIACKRQVRLSERFGTIYSAVRVARLNLPITKSTSSYLHDGSLSELLWNAGRLHKNNINIVYAVVAGQHLHLLLTVNNSNGGTRVY